MGIGFGALVDLLDVWVAGHGVAPAKAIRFVGWRGTTEVSRSEWFALTAGPQRVPLGFKSIDRVEAQAAPFVERMGFYALDDLRFVRAGQAAGTARVLDFEDLAPRQVLTATGYASLTWESGRGFQDPVQDTGIVPAPIGLDADSGLATEIGVLPNAAGVTTPAVWDDFIGVTQGDPGANLIPPDTCGANGPDHFVVIVNSNLSAFTKTTQQRVLNVSLGSFWNASGTVGDPRIVFDPHSQRYIALATDFSGTRTLFYAVSQTSNPAGSWFKFSFRTDQGSDAGKWPDYPTLGVDARGIYSAAYMVGTGSLMTIWAIDKAPLLATPPSVGTITAFRSLPWEGAIQPCTTYGDPGGQYCVSRRSSTLMRVRRINPPLSAPTLVETGSATIPSHSSPPSAPALGSTTPISTIDTRPMNAVFRNGSLYTVHAISFNSRAACRWYQLGVAPVSLQQYGTLADSLWHYYYASIAVDAHGNLGVGFSGSHANAYCSTFVTGRRAVDPAGQTAPPIKVKDGEAPWNRVDGAGRNRFGDYSHIDVEAVDDLGFWTVQEYIWQNNVWRTRVTRLGFEAVNFESGLAGKNGVPSLRTAARPVIGKTLTVQVGNSAGVATQGFLLLGVQTIAVPIVGGTVWVNPLVIMAVTVQVPKTDVPLPYPNDLTLVGQPLYFQSLQLDTGAVQGFAFSPGLEVRAGSR
jgi:hypothetical protein